MQRELLAAAVTAAIAPMAAQALDVSVSGQVNRAIRFADNGASSDVQHIDGSASKSRFRLSDEGGVDSRHSLLYFSGDFGRVFLDLVSPCPPPPPCPWCPPPPPPCPPCPEPWTWPAASYSPDTNSGLGVMVSDGTSEGYSVFSFFPSVNISRKNALRYETPSIGPITVPVSVHKDGTAGHSWSFGGSLAHDVGAANAIAGLVYMDDVLGIAGGLAFANGTSVNAAWGSDDDSGEDYEDMYINVAHSWGNMSVAVDYRSTENGADVEGPAIGLGAQYALGGGIDVYAGFNGYSFEGSYSAPLTIAGLNTGGTTITFP